jgi:hypothetical protein
VIEAFGMTTEFENLNSLTIMCPANCRIVFCKPGVEKLSKLEITPGVNKAVQPGNFLDENQLPM